MTKDELEKALIARSIDPKRYSLNGESKLDAIILYDLKVKWEVFYLDERGGRNQEKEFNSENDACQYILKLFLDALVTKP
jgi:hypothetical protein